MEDSTTFPTPRDIATAIFNAWHYEGSTFSDIIGSIHQMTPQQFNDFVKSLS